MSVAEAAAFDNKIIYGEMICGEYGSAGVFGLAGARLALQQADSQVGDHELVLSSGSIRIHGLPGRQGAVDHLETQGQGPCENLSIPVLFQM